MSYRTVHLCGDRQASTALYATLMMGQVFQGVDQQHWNQAFVTENVLQACHPATAIRLARLIRAQLTLMEMDVELLAFDEKLRPYADIRISLELDDGEKVNYGKFGDLLAKVKAVWGKDED